MPVSVWRRQTYKRGTLCLAQSTSTHHASPADIPVSRRQLCLTAAQLVAGASLIATRPATADETRAKRKNLPIEELKDIIAVSSLSLS